MDEVLWAAAMVAAILLLLGILHGLCQVHHELFHNPINTVRVLNFFFLLSQHFPLPSAPGAQWLF